LILNKIKMNTLKKMKTNNPLKRRNKIIAKTQMNKIKMMMKRTKKKVRRKVKRKIKIQIMSPIKKRKKKLSTLTENKVSKIIKELIASLNNNNSI
jgi:hypothetical protein